MYSYFTDVSLNYEPLRGEIVPLNDQDFVDAHQMSQRLPNAETPDRHHWTVYLHTLALHSFRHWFAQRTTATPLNESQTVMVMAEADDNAALCGLQVDAFRLCLGIVEGDLEQWHLPRSTVQSPNLAAHFYVAIALHEEASYAEILGFLRHDQIAETALVEDTYRLAIADLTSDLDTLLLHLSCLDVQAIPLPVSITPSTIINQDLQQFLMQPIINTRQWLNQQLDTLASAISWQFLPTWEFGNRRIRDRDDQPTEMLSSILTTLVRNGMDIPIDHQSAYRDLLFGGSVFRLYAMTAAQDPEPDRPPEWSLLVILCQPNGENLPPDLHLQIHDATNLLVDRQASPNPVHYIYARVIGSQTEAFTLGLSTDHHHLTLPPFTFQ